MVLGFGNFYECFNCAIEYNYRSKSNEHIKPFAEVCGFECFTGIANAPGLLPNEIIYICISVFYYIRVRII